MTDSYDADTLRREIERLRAYFQARGDAYMHEGNTVAAAEQYATASDIGRALRRAGATDA